MQNSESTWRRFPGGPELLLGAGALAALPEMLSPDERYLIVSDPGVSAAGIVAELAATLRAASIAHAVFDEVRVDPDVLLVESALDMARREDCTAVIGIGGGSSLDAAKAVAVRFARSDSLRSYGDGLEVRAPIAPLYAVPTTAGTGSETTRVAVITDPESNEKMAIRGDALLPRAAVLDPRLLATLPAKVAAACGADALTHAIEAYVSRNADALSDSLALAAIEIVGAHLARFVRQPDDLVEGEQMLLASHLAGKAFASAGLGLAHSLAEPLGAFHHVEHGLGCALFLPVVMEFNLSAASERYARIARALAAGESADDALAAVKRLFAEIGLPASYKEAGVDFSLLPEMLAQVPPQFSTRCNPRNSDAGDHEHLFRALEA